MDSLDMIKTPKLEGVTLVERYGGNQSPSKGTLYFATTHLIYVDHNLKRETWVPLTQVSSVERGAISTTGCSLHIRTHTFHSLHFLIPRERDAHDLHHTLLALSQPATIEELYCFKYRAGPEELPRAAGWKYFDMHTEYQRMNVPNHHWKLCNDNNDYQLCDTYPSEVYVPVGATPSMLAASALFRSRGRLPVLAYLHHNMAAITRCAQPLSGFSARCVEDEQLLECIQAANPNSRYMYVVDTRPRINAMVNRAAGKGYENEAFYENIKFHFIGIHNIHVMRKSLHKLLDACEQSSVGMSAFLSGLEDSGWLKHIKSILETSSWIAEAVSIGVSVLVHCSDGWDRTSQVCSLAAMMLDPHYRTINGFQALIEKDWVRFGHKFSARCGHIAGDPKERAPVFTQLLDCVWQLLQQEPAAFQFNERFLVALQEAAHGCQYGTFVGESERERAALALSERTFSLWGYMAAHLPDYKNPFYEPKLHTGVVRPRLQSQCVKFWRGLYCRHEGGVHPRDPLPDMLHHAAAHTAALNDHVAYLHKKIATFKNLLRKRRCSPGRFNGDIAHIDASLQDLSMDNRSHPLADVTYESQSERVRVVDATAPLDTGGVETGLDAGVEGVARVERELASVALEWATLKGVRECACSTPLPHHATKVVCWGCGRVWCERCGGGAAPLPALSSSRPAPLCAPCRQNITAT